MALTDPLVLPPDVLLVPARRLTARQRKQFGARPEDFALTRPNSRSHSKIVSPGTAELLARFRTATLVVDAIEAHGKARGADAELVLDEAFPVLAECYDAGLLVPASSPAAREILPLFLTGDRIGEFEVVRAIRVLEDSEIYLGRADDGEAVALKIIRPGRRPRVAESFAREGRILAALRGPATPRLIARGRHRRRPYLALEWCAGVPPEVAFGELRGSRDAEQRNQLLRLAVRIVGAYASLHADGVLHGDIQPDNILIDARGRVRLIDFGAARRIRSRPPWPGRAGVAYYFEPELAAALLANELGPQPTAAGEQFAVAAMVYYLIAGAHYLEFRLNRDAMLEQIAKESPLPFSGRQAAPWPAVETVLARALSRNPAQRFPSMAAFRTALARAARTPPPIESPKVSKRKSVDPVADTLAAVDPQAQFFRDGLPEGPTASVWLGGAGIAFGLHRLASAREDPRLLAWADLWLTRAERNAGRPEAFVGGDITPSDVGPVSLYHSPTGLFVVRALISVAFGNSAMVTAATQRFILAAESAEPPGIDLTFGRAGLLLGATLLYEALPEECDDAASLLLAFGRRQNDVIWQVLDSAGPIARSRTIAELGIAHGWAGILYSVLRWCATTGATVPRAMPERLAELAALAQEAGRGVRWRTVNAERETTPDFEYLPGWCNGSAGFVHLWSAAAAMYSRGGYDDLLVRAGWNAWETTDGLADLCCGAIGRAYALINLYRHTGDAAWLERARTLHDRLLTGLSKRIAGRTGRTGRSGRPAEPRYAQSLYKGKMGLSLLTSDLDRPESAAMPLFESEGWPSRARRPHA